MGNRALLWIGWIGALAGCVDAEGVVDADGGGADGIGASAPQDGSAGGDDASAGIVAARLRVINLARDLGSIDVCFRPSMGANFDGPALALANVGAPDAGPAADASAPSTPDAADGSARDAAPDPGIGVAFAKVSPYFVVRGSGSFEVAIVAAGERSCARSLAAGRITVDAGRRATVAVMPAGPASAGASVSIVAFVDDATPSPTSARVRVVNASEDATSLDVSSAGATGDRPLASGVASRRAAAPTGGTPPVDAMGYATVEPAGDPVALTIQAANDAGGARWSTAPAALHLVRESVHTGFVAGGAAGHVVSWCDDALGTCTLLSAK